MAIMITGGTGFLGAAIARHLVQKKGESGVVLFDSLADDSLVKDIADSVVVVQGDVLQPLELLEAMRKNGVEKVVHLAALQGPAVDANPPRSIQLNGVGTTNVFEASRVHGVKRITYASSIGVYSVRKNLIDDEINEDMLPAGASLYGACKLLNETVADFYHRRHGLDPIGLRPTAVFGIGRSLSRLRSHGQGMMLVADLTAGGLVAVTGALMNDRPVQMPPNEQVVDWLYSADLAEAFCCALAVEDPPHRVFNVAAERRPVGDFTSKMRDLFPNAQITMSAEPAVAMPLTSTERLRTELGFAPQYTLETMLDEYVDRVRSGAVP